MISAHSQTIVLVDDHEDALYAGKRMLEHAGYKVITGQDGFEAIKIIKDNKPDLVLLDIMMPKLDGIEVTKRLKSDKELKYIPLILLTGKSSLEDIVEGLDAGADGYIIKPFKPDELLARIKAALRMKGLYTELKKSLDINERLVSEAASKYSDKNIVGESKAMKEVLSLVMKVSKADAPVLISGASGTGKELIARSIHFNSLRRNAPFIAKNCAAFSEQLLESELFGHVKGSFTGAIKDHKGLFESANNGTLFLDELGEMPLHLQAKLLRVLQEGLIMPIGSAEEFPVDVRVVAATNKDLRSMVEEGRFREDLFYRLNVVQLELPTLKERKEDIPLLITYFLDKAYQKYTGIRKHLSREVLDIFINNNWQGNIRELENEIERMIILSGPDEIELGTELLSKHLLGGLTSHSAKKSSFTPDGEVDLKTAISELEKLMIKNSLEKTKGNKSTSAKELGISRSSLISKVQDYGLE